MPLLLAACATFAAGCPTAVDELEERRCPPFTDAVIVERLTQTSVDKADLLLVIDNSPSMADKQQILAAAVPDLVGTLINPRCLGAGGVASTQQPSGPLDDCPPGAQRELGPVLDIHIGVVSSSLGGHGSVERYVNALTQPAINPTNDALALAAGQPGVPNPIYGDLQGKDHDAMIRDGSLVFLAGVVGVPWQDIARDPNDLTKGFKSGDEMATPDMAGDTTWDIVLGDPAGNVPPKDPLMIESIAPRTGTSPVVGAPLAPPGSAPDANPINGHEYTIADDGDLQYACVFDLPVPRDCSDASIASCDCKDPANDNPLCDATAKTLQTKAKAYPGLRELSVLKGLGSQGVTASICPKQVADPGSRDFGYRPAIGAIIERLKRALAAQCLPLTLTPDASGAVACKVLEARRADGACACDPAKGRIAVPQEDEWLVATAQQDPMAGAAPWNCFCEIAQLEGAALDACRTQADNPVVADGKNVSGWCYVDASSDPPLGNPAIVSACPPDEQRLIRFVGAADTAMSATLYLTCGPAPECGR